MSHESISPSRHRRPARHAGLRWRCLLGAVLLALPASALAKRVALTPFEGPHAEAAQKAVAEVLIKDGHEVVDVVEWKAALAAVGTKATPDETFAAAAKRLRVSAIVVGTVKPLRRRAAVLVISVHDGRTGTRLEGFEVPLKRGRIDDAATTTLVLNLPPVIPLGQDPVESAPPPPPAPDTETPEALAARRAARQAASAPAVAPRRRSSPIAVVGLGLNLWGRRMKPAPGGSADAYSGGPVPPGLHLEGEAYPLARFMDGIAGDFGVGVYFDQAWLKSKFPAAAGDIDVTTTQTRAGVDLRFRRRFLPDHPFGPTVRGSLAFAYTGFKLKGSDRALIGNLNLPDATLYGVGPTVGAIVPLGRPWLRAGMSFGVMYVAGPDSNAPSGATFGNGWGIDWTVHADYLPLKWLQLRAQLGITHYGSSISSTAPATTTSLADTYFSGLLTAAYVY